MRIYKCYMALIIVFASLSGMAQSKNHTQRLERHGDTLYLVENDERFKVDTEVITGVTGGQARCEV